MSFSKSAFASSGGAAAGAGGGSVAFRARKAPPSIPRSEPSAGAGGGGAGAGGSGGASHAGASHGTGGAATDIAGAAVPWP